MGKLTNKMSAKKAKKSKKVTKTVDTTATLETTVENPVEIKIHEPVLAETPTVETPTVETPVETLETSVATQATEVPVQEGPVVPAQPVESQLVAEVAAPASDPLVVIPGLVAAENVKPRIRRPGSGRTKGAVSFHTVQLAELNRVLQPGAMIPVSRVWLQKFLQNQVQSSPISATPAKMDELAGGIDYKVHDLSKPEAEDQEDDSNIPTGFEKTDELAVVE